MAAEPEVREIIIVRRRRGSGHDDHHGGVWKIAFADFMTALMAFFLVLWIVNSTSKETRSSVARYFNPIKLADTTAARKGLREAKDNEFEDVKDEHKSPPAESRNNAGDAAHKKPPDKATDAKPGASDHANADADEPKSVTLQAPPNARPPTNLPAGYKPPVRSESVLFADPAAALTEIEQAPDEAPESNGIHGPRVLRDPFATAPFTPAAAMSNTQRPGEPGDPVARSHRINASGAAPARPKPWGADVGPSDTTAPTRGGAEALREKLDRALAKIDQSAPRPRLDVQNTSEGLLISLTDSVDFGMFAVGSAEPRKKTVQFLGRIGEALKTQGGAITVRGFTDARQFRASGSDNWRLSASRAQMAFHMLVRGGVAEKRFARIEAHADRSPRNTRSADAAENRRIEILVRDPGAWR